MIGLRSRAIEMIHNQANVKVQGAPPMPFALESSFEEHREALTAGAGRAPENPIPEGGVEVVTSADIID